MRKRYAAFATLLILTVTIAMAVAADNAVKKPVTNKMCPVMNAAVSEKFRTEYKHQYVYFCCQGCIKMFEKDPEGYIAKLSKEDQEAVKANDICPLTEDKITEFNLFVEHDGRKVYLCCDGCVTAYKAKLAEKKDGQ